MKLKAEKGVFATLVVTPVTGGAQRIDGLEAIKDYLANLPATQSLGSKENPHDTGAPTLKGGYYILHPRVLNDPELPKSFKDEAKRAFTGELKPDYIAQVYLSGDGKPHGAVKPNGKGQFYVDYRIPVRCSGWYGGAVVNIAANDLLKQNTTGVTWSSIVKAERRRYRVWKDAQLKEAKCLTRKRIMKALASPADAQLKFGDAIRHIDNKQANYTFIGYAGYFHGTILLLDNRDGKIYTSSRLEEYIKA